LFPFLIPTMLLSGSIFIIYPIIFGIYFFIC
jgi:hypothetical protein